MDKQIKFRAYDEGNKIMHYDFQFVKSGDAGNDWILFTSDKQPISDYDKWTTSPYFSQQLKIMQFTGLCDRTGKEIYEGDVVTFHNTKFDHRKNDYIEIETSSTGIIGVNKYNQCCVWVDGREWHICNALRGEIIGNTHENSNLLNK